MGVVIVQEINDMASRAKYGGYTGINLDNFSIDKVKGIVVFVKGFLDKNYFDICDFSNVDSISLDEVKRLTREVLDKYFTIANIDTIDLDVVGKDITKICVETPEEFYNEVNNLLVSKSPYDLDVKLIQGHSMIGEVSKPLMLTDEFDTPNRKIYFSHIGLGNQLTGVSAGTLAHEITHTQQERHLGYAEDYLHREVLSIFVEKLVANEIDPTGKLLQLSERVRFSQLLGQYLNCKNKVNYSKDQEINDLMYIKSTLIANKLFDMYMSERKQKNRDKYIDDIQKVFDGKITVEELINSRNITISKCQDPMLLKRRS